MLSFLRKLGYLIAANEELDSLIADKRAELEKERTRKRNLELNLCDMHAGTNYGFCRSNCDYCNLASKLQLILKHNPTLPINLRGYRVPKTYL